MDVPKAIANTIVDPKAYAAGTPVDEAFTWLRANAPFAKVEADGYEPMWVVTRHQDILDAELNPALFNSGERESILLPEAVLKARAESGFTGSRTLIQMDPPDHNEFRRITQGWFMPKNLRAIEDRIRVLARDTADRMASFGDRCDFAKDVALLYPLQVIMEILGVPAEDEGLMLKLTQEMFGARDPEVSRGGAAAADPVQAQANLEKTLADLQGYFEKMTYDRRANPTSDVASVIANGTVRGELISLPDAIGYYIISATAGHDTTSSTSSAGMWALAERPELLARLKSQPDLIKQFIDESVRWASAVKHFMRTISYDAEFAGQPVKKGDRVMLSYASANRDETVFDRPFEFDIDRKPNRHVAFGYGPHVCLGQHLANLEMRIFWEELIPRLESVELDGNPRRVEANFVSGPKSVPIRFRLSA